MYSMYVQNMKINKKDGTPLRNLKVIIPFFKVTKKNSKGILTLIRMAKNKNDLVEFEGLNAEYKKKSEKYLFLLLDGNLSMILMLVKKFQKNKDKICPWPLCTGLKGILRDV
jgi:hypothetical protein